MANSVKQEKRKFIVQILIIVIIAALIGVVVWILTSGKETHTTTTYEEDKSSTIVCKVGNIEDSFFYNQSAHDVSQSVKVLLTNDKMSKISYEYKAKYDSDGQAESAIANFRANYNKYLGKYNISSTALSPTMNAVGTDAMVSLFTDANGLTNYTAKLFLLDSSNYYSAKISSGDKLKKLFENKGMSCEYQK